MQLSLEFFVLSKRCHKHSSCASNVCHSDPERAGRVEGEESPHLPLSLPVLEPSRATIIRDAHLTAKGVSVYLRHRTGETMSLAHVFKAGWPAAYQLPISSQPTNNQPTTTAEVLSCVRRKPHGFGRLGGIKRQEKISGARSASFSRTGKRLARLLDTDIDYHDRVAYFVSPWGCGIAAPPSSGWRCS